MTQWLRPPGQQGPGIGEQFAKKAATNLAAKEAAKLGLGAAGTAVGGPLGGATGTALGELAGPLAGQLVSSLFSGGGEAGKKKSSIWDKARSAAAHAWKNDNLAKSEGRWKNAKPKYKAIGGMTTGPLGMPDMVIAGKDKSISAVKMKKAMGDMIEEVEVNYHPPLAAKPKTGE